MKKHLYVEFESGKHLDIELADSLFVDIWIDQHHAAKKATDAKYLCRQGQLFYHGNTFNETESHYSTRVDSVKNINSAITKLKRLYDLDFPYHAYMGMEWEHTNKMHRCFTTAMISWSCWEFRGHTRPDLFKFKSYVAPPFDDRERNNRERAEAFFVNATVDFTPQMDGYSLRKGIVELLEQINTWIHMYEDHSFEQTCKVAENAQAQYNIQDLNYLDVEWEDPHGRIDYESATLSKSLLPLCDYNPDDYDVYFNKSITGKDYFQAYHEYDDPLEYDIENYGNCNGGFSVQPSKLQAKWFHTAEAKTWLTAKGMTMNYSLLQPPALGKVLNREWFDDWDKIEWDETKRNVFGGAKLNAAGSVTNTTIS